MTRTQKFKIDLTKPFHHLRNAPIVEAAIEIRARAEVPWDESSVSQELKAKLALGYPSVLTQNEFQGETKFIPGQAVESAIRDLKWRGLVFRSGDDRHVAQFNRDGFIFSRLRPYENWDQLYGEAMRLWRFYKDVARPTEAQRIGLRFINRIELGPGELRFEDYIQPAPRPPRAMDLPFVAFFQRDSLEATGYPYGINVTRATQRDTKPVSAGVAVILDIDVICFSVADLQEETLNKTLSEMRWLKNKAFFGSITNKAIKRFGGLTK